MKRRSVRRHQQRGFTLMEVLLVVAILLILAGLAVVAVTRTLVNAKANAAKLEMSSLAQSVEHYFVDVGVYPPDLNALVAAPDDLADPTKWHGPYLKKPELPKDPWGGPYEYQVQDNTVYVRSAGPDGQFDTDDDVRST